MEKQKAHWLVSELAVEFDLSTRTVRDYILGGKLQATRERPGRHGVPYLVSNEEMMRFKSANLAPGVRTRRGRPKTRPRVS